VGSAYHFIPQGLSAASSGEVSQNGRSGFTSKSREREFCIGRQMEANIVIACWRGQLGGLAGPRFPGSFAVVAQRARRRRTCNARDRAQIFVDRPEVVVGHVLVSEPRHYLEKITVERRGEAVGGHGS
jgi:hypothetical protein